MSILTSLFRKKEKTQHRQLVEAGALIIDVRSPDEFKSGHIKGSINIPLSTMAGEAAALKKRNKTIITCCRSGARSGMAATILKAAGIEVVNGGPWNELERKLR